VWERIWNSFKKFNILIIQPVIANIFNGAGYLLGAALVRKFVLMPLLGFKYESFVLPIPASS